MSNKYICPCCGLDVTEVVNARADEIDADYFNQLAKTGGKIGGKITGPANMAKLNASYTLDKRKAAALKAWETKRRKAAEGK